jgi:hypothetical protein
MYVKVLTFELSPSDRSDDNYAAFVTRFADRNVRALRQFGLLDGYLVRTSEDTIMTVNFYESAEGAHQAFATLTGTQRYADAMGLTLLTHQEGPATDLPLSMHEAHAR